MRIITCAACVLVALSGLMSPAATYAQEKPAVLCVKKIGKTNVRGRDVYISRTGNCRFPLYQKVNITVEANAAGPQGPAGPAGEPGAPGFVDVTSCYSKTASNYDEPSSSSSSSSSSSEPSALAGGYDSYNRVKVYCDDPTQEFVLESGWKTDRYGASVYSDQPLLEDEEGNTWTYPIGRKVKMNDWDFAQSDCGDKGCYPELRVTIVCCNSGQTVEGTPEIQPTPTFK